MSGVVVTAMFSPPRHEFATLVCSCNRDAAASGKALLVGGTIRPSLPEAFRLTQTRPAVPGALHLLTQCPDFGVALYDGLAIGPGKRRSAVAGIPDHWPGRGLVTQVGPLQVERVAAVDADACHRGGSWASERRFGPLVAIHVEEGISSCVRIMVCLPVDRVIAYGHPIVPPCRKGGLSRRIQVGSDCAASQRNGLQLRSCSETPVSIKRGDGKEAIPHRLRAYPNNP